MGKRNNYRELVSILDFFLKSRENTKEESELFSDLSEVLDTNKKNKIMAQLFYQNEYTVDLLDRINQSILEYQEKLKNYELNDCSPLDFDMVKKSNLEGKTSELMKLMELMELRRRVLTHFDSQVDYHDLVSKCVSSLSTEGFLSKYYGESLVVKDSQGFRINKGVVRQVYNFLTNSQQIAKLESGVRIVQNIKDATQNVATCDEALNYKEEVYHNQKDIFQYNHIKEQIMEVNSKISDYDCNGDFEKDLRRLDRKLSYLKSSKLKRLIHSCTIADLEEERPYIVEMIENRKRCIELRNRLVRDLSIVKKRLADSALGEVITRVEADELFYNKNCKSPKNSLANKIPTFKKVEDIDAYYQFIKKFRDEANEELEKSRKLKESFDRCAAGYLKSLIDYDFETAINILTLKDAKEINGITPVIALYVLEMLVSMEDTELCDMDVTSDDFERTKNSEKSFIDMNVGRYVDEYLDIIRPKKGNTYKKYFL